MPAEPNQVSSTPVASEEAAMLTALLPSKSAPISRSRLASRRLTMPARRSPCFSSRAMLARDDAVNAVSLPAKKADSRRQITTTTSDIQSAAVMGSGDGVSQKRAHVGRIDIAFDEGLADAAHENESERAAFHFLVLCDQTHQGIDARDAAGNLPNMGRQADRRKVRPGPRGVGGAAKAFARRVVERHDHAECHSL